MGGCRIRAPALSVPGLRLSTSLFTGPERSRRWSKTATTSGATDNWTYAFGAAEVVRLDHAQLRSRRGKRLRGLFVAAAECAIPKGRLS
jgi:hypothetical protein